MQRPHSAEELRRPRLDLLVPEPVERAARRPTVFQFAQVGDVGLLPDGLDQAAKPLRQRSEPAAGFDQSHDQVGIDARVVDALVLPPAIELFEGGETQDAAVDVGTLHDGAPNVRRADYDHFLQHHYLPY